MATGGDATPTQQFSPHDLARQLEPALLEACGGRLRDVHWFRTDWQRGGAATGYAVFEFDSGPREAVVKLPVGPREHRILTTLSDSDGPTPRLATSGTEIGGWDFAWVVMERVAGNPLAAHLHKQVFEDLAHAAALFYKHAGEALPSPEPPPVVAWEDQLERAREAVRTNNVPHAQNWTTALKHVQKALPRLLATWNARAAYTWCHGDLHPGNLMRRDGNSPWGAEACVLLDYAEVHAGHWVEDAVYLERLYWARPAALDGAKPVSLIAKARRALGLDASDDYAAMANIRRVLMAATVPAFLRHEGHPRYLEACLGVLERTMAAVGK